MIRNVLLYIDPGTGSMLFTIVIGIVSVVVFFLRSFLIKLKFFSSKDRNAVDNNYYKFAIFSDDKRYWNTFEPICNEFEKRQVEVVFFTASEDDPALKKDYKYVKCIFAGKGNAAFSKLNLLKADILLSTTPNLDVYQWKRSRDVKCYVHILHCVGDPLLYHMFSLDSYDVFLTSGPAFIRPIRLLEELRGESPKEIIEVGLPYLDTIYEKKNKTAPVINETPVVLLSPTWGVNGILSLYGEDFIKALIDTGYHIIVRPHPQSFKSEKEMIDRLMAKFPANDKFEWNRDNDNFEVLNRSDIMISDYSGIIYDYSLVFNKPVLCAEFEYDVSQCDAYWLPDERIWNYVTIRKIGSSFGPDYKDRIKDLIDENLNSASRMDAIESIRKEGWVNIGNSAKITVDYMINKQKELSNKVK